ncbi:hypothetical protein Mycch_5109 [Mycolicibacterium chubuense NBB4]|uniref:Protein TolB n=1 Tax=Mycolicibacterium chubuense (strain NBB4) TaxID=710421 RepID=I4BR88_MYCCN|nr:hypothetical protein [Mycolicibacterium chubuense]AFM19795.1 hypothetical protein Mycch_5109 [Mycolicibacterium chubuense NBB4]
MSIQTSTTRTPVRVLLLTLAAIATVLAACTGVQPGPTGASGSGPKPSSPFDPTTQPAVTGPLLAYRASDEIGLVDGTKVVAKAAGEFPPANDLIATEDDRFVFARTADGRLAVIDVANRRGTTRPIPVGPVLGTAGQSTIVWWEQPDRLMRLDLADPNSQPVLAQAVALPPVAGGQSGEPRLLVARGGTAVLARVEGPPSPFGGPDTLYAVRGPGAPSPLGQVDANSPVSVARLSPDGASLAYAVYRATDAGCGAAAVVQSNANGAQQTFEVAGSDAAAGSRVTKLWWPSEGAPKLSLTTWRCGRPATDPPVVWQLAGDHIEQTAPPTAALQTAELEPGRRALILPKTASYGEPVGTLVYEESSRRFPIKDGVDAIAVIQPSP